MAKRVQVQTDMTAEELHVRYRHTKDAVERTHWHILWQVKEGKSPREVAELLGYTARWVRTIIQRWNVQGDKGIQDHRHEIAGSQPLLSAEQQAELAQRRRCSLDNRLRGIALLRLPGRGEADLKRLVDRS